MIEARTFSPSQSFWLLLVLSAAVGAVVAFQPLVGGLIPAAVLALFLLLRVERPVLATFLVLLIIQDPVLFLVGGENTFLGMIVKRSDEALLLAVAGWILFQSVASHRAIATQWLWLLMAACLGGMVISTIPTHMGMRPALLDLLLFSKPFLLFIIGTSVVISERDVRDVTGIGLLLSIAIVVSALLFLVFPSVQDAYLGTLRVADTRMGFRSAQGFFDGPGPYSWFCAATFALAYSAYFAFNRSRYLFAAIVAALFTVLSWRRKSMGGIVAMVLVTLLLHSRNHPKARKRAFVVLVLGVVFSITALAPFIAGLWHYTAHEYIDDPGSTARYALYTTSVRIAADNFPLGAGLASFGSHASAVYYSDVYREYGLSDIWGLSPSYSHFVTDTFWPMVLGEGGIVTLIPYALFMVLIIRVCWKAARRSDLSQNDRFVAMWGLLVLVGSLFESTSSSIYDSTMQSSLALIPAGIAWQRFAVPKWPFTASP